MTNSALIIGASRGLGRAMAEEYLKRGWDVVATVRRADALADLADRAGGKLEVELLDINELDQVAALGGRLAGRSFDLLFVNAGILEHAEETIGEVSTEGFTRMMVTNALSPMRVIEALQDLVSSTGTIGAMSSGLASIADNEAGGYEVYRATKAALNTLMRSYAARHKTGKRALVLMAPGWVRTDMGGPSAPFSMEENVPKVVEALIAQAGKPGLRFVNYGGETLRW